MISYKTLAVITALVFTTTFLFSADRYWIAGAPSNWNNTANWSTTSGGSGGASVPGATDVAIFDANGLGNCTVDAAATLGGLTVNGYTGTIDINGLSFQVTSGNVDLYTGTINDVPNISALTINTTGQVRFQGTTFGAVVNSTSERAFLNGSTFNNTTSITKNGAGNDAGSGGNTFNGTTTLGNIGTSYLMTGNGNPDSFNNGVTLNNNGSNHIYIANNSAGNTVTGDLTINNSGTGSNSQTRICENAASSLTVTGNVLITNNGTANTNYTYFGINGDVTVTGNLTITNSTGGTDDRVYVANGTNSSVSVGGITTVNNTSSATNSRVYLGENGDITFAGDVTLTNNSNGTNGRIRIANGTNSNVTINGKTTVNNLGAPTNLERIWLANQGEITFNDSLIISNSSAATNSEVFCNYNANSVNTYNEHVVIESTDANSDGVRFGEAGGVGTLAGSKTITIGSGGFIAGQLRFRNFTQTGATAQNIALTGTGYLYNTDADWGGDVVFSAPRFRTDGTTYGGTANFSKTGATNDASAGGNVIAGNCTMTNTGSGYFMMGNGSPDTFALDLTMTNSGTYHMYLAYNSSDNFIGGNLTATNSGSGTNSQWRSLDAVGSSLDVVGNVSITNSGAAAAQYVYLAITGDLTIGGDLLLDNTGSGTNCYTHLANSNTSTVNIGGDVTLNNTASGTNANTYLGVNGDVSITGALNITHNPTATNGNTYLGNGTDASITIGGTATVLNSGSGTTQRTYLGNSGDVVFNGALNITNTSDATNSQVYCNHAANSINAYNENIVLENTNASGDGVYFGNGGGSGTLAATKTVTIGGGGFVTGYCYFRNFTQIGATAQAITLTGTGYFYNYDSNWGGDVDFRGARMTTRGTLYNGTAYLEKTGADNDQSQGGNKFLSTVELRNSGSGYLLMGNGAPDSCMADLTLNNTGTNRMYYAYNSADNYLNQDLMVNNSGSGADNNFYIGDLAASTLTVDGDVNISNTSSATNATLYLGNSGDITLNGRLDVTNNTSGTTGQFVLANSASSSASLAGVANILNAGSGTTNRTYLGNHGDVTFNDSLIIINSASSASSEVRCNDNTNSTNLYNGNIVVENLDAAGDGVRFGQSGGAGTLAATRKITIGSGGFIAGDLQFRNFTQVGPTDHDLTCTGTARIYNYDSNWGGNVDFRAPRMLTRATTYNQTAYLEKTGGVGDDASVGGNTFVGNTELRNSGSFYFLMGNGSPDDFQGNLLLNNTGTDHMYLAYNSAGNSIAGTLTVNNTGSGSATNLQISDQAASTLSVTGDVTINNTSSATTANIYLGNAGDVILSARLDVDNNTSGTTGQFYLASNAASSVNIAGVANISNAGNGTTNRTYLGNQGDVTFSDSLIILNSASSANSHVYCNYSTNSVNVYNGHIVVENTNVNGDGILFGQNTGSGTLAATRTVTIGTGGFVAGDLTFRNFTQVGPTAQTLLCTGTARIYNYDSDWGGDVDFRAPAMNTRGTTYNGTSYLEKTGGVYNDNCAGGNTFVGSTELRNSGSLYLLMGNGSLDVFQDNLLMNNTGSNRMYLAYNSAGNSITGDLTVNNSGTSGNTYVYLSDLTASTLSIGGNTVINNNGSSTNCYTYVGNQGDITFGGTLDMTNSATSTNGLITLGNNTNSTVLVSGITTVVNSASGGNQTIYLGNVGDVTFNDNVTITNSSNATNGQIYIASSAAAEVIFNGTTNDFTNSGIGTTTRYWIGNQGDVTFNGNLDMSNSSSATNSEMFLNYNANSINTYNEDITVECTDASCDGIRFGQGNGAGTLAASKTITLGGGGFIAGQLYFRNFTQLSTTAQSLDLSGTALIYNYDSEWNGDVVFSAPRHITRGTTYNGTAALTKEDAVNDYCNGGNIYNDDVTFTNAGTGYFLFGGSVSEDHNGDVTFIKNNTGLMYPDYNTTGTYAGDINFDFNTQVTFGAAGNGRSVMDGTAAQSINDLGSSIEPRFRDLQTNNPNDEVTLNTPITVITELDLDAGNINTTATNLLTMNDNSIVSSVSHDAHVDGPIEKIGNDAFVFPVGDSGVYRSIAISAPSSGAARFRAEYINDDPHPTYDDALKDNSIQHISSCEHWFLDRTNSTNNVSVTLSWDSVISCGVDEPSDLLVARWDGGQWKDHGNGGTTGNNQNGTVVTSAPVTNFSPFTLASTKANNPLPIELIRFDAVKEDNTVDLNWTTATEINNDYFTIEKTSNGEDFVIVAEVTGAGNSNGILNYSTVDETPYKGISYYRLKQTDFDGKTSYSELAIVNFEEDNNISFSIYPNPASDNLYIAVSGSAEKLPVKIYNAVGEIVWQQTLSTAVEQVNTSRLAAGIYTLTLKTNTKTITEKLVIK